MAYPYPKIVEHTKRLCEVQGHKSCSNALIKLDITIAICPFCGVNIIETVNVAEIEGIDFNNPLETNILPLDFPVNPPCTHFLGVHGFKNLHRNRPPGNKYVSVWSGEVPFVTPWFCPEDVESYVIVNGVPIFEWLDGDLKPMYTLFTMTYFSVDPKGLINRHYKNQFEGGEDDDEYYPETVGMPPLFGTVSKENLNRYDLAKWAENGKLGYVDLTTDNELTLVIGKNTTLPKIYKAINGNVNPFKWQYGKRRPSKLTNVMFRSVSSFFSLITGR